MKWYSKIALFLISSLLLYVGAIYLLSHVSLGTYPLIYSLSDGLNLTGGNSFQTFNEFDKSEKYDVLVVGSSHAYRGYDPREFEKEGYSAFNLGTSSQTPLNSYFLVRDYLSKENCGLLILDVYPVVFQMEALESTADLVQNLSSNWSAASMASAMKDPRALNMFAVRMLNNTSYYTDTTYTGRGFSESNRQVQEPIEYPQMQKATLRQDQLCYLQKTIELCVERSIPVVMVDHPIPNKMQSEARVEAVNELKNIAEKSRIPFADFSKSLKMNSLEHFYDHTHLNQKGVVLFNAELLAWLQKNQLLLP